VRCDCIIIPRINTEEQTERPWKLSMHQQGKKHSRLNQNALASAASSGEELWIIPEHRAASKFTIVPVAESLQPCLVPAASLRLVVAMGVPCPSPCPFLCAVSPLLLLQAASCSVDSCSLTFGAVTEQMRPHLALAAVVSCQPALERLRRFLGTLPTPWLPPLLEPAGFVHR
jgi:hypothetical protein